MKPSAFLIAAVAPLAACTAEPDGGAEVSAPAVTVAGAPVDCVLVDRIRNTVVHDDYTIDFVLTGVHRRWYRAWPCHVREPAGDLQAAG